MKYFISKCDCLYKNQKLESNVKYEIIDFNSENEIKTLNKKNTISFLDNERVLKFQYKQNEYFLLCADDDNEFFACSFMCGKNLISVNIATNLKVIINGVVKTNIQVSHIHYSHCEEFLKHLILYFTGERNFVVIIKDDQVKAFSFYDEFNETENEKYFMCKLNDSLNHGKVIHIFEEKVDNYLVYLDDNDMCLKEQFVSCVFLDCLKAGNYNYCNNLLGESLKQESVTNIKNFFCEFDFVYPLEENVFALIQKNTLSGIYKFEVLNSKIENIIIC